LTFFDFDECEYNWFIADIANPLFYVTPLKSEGIEQRNRAAKRFFDYFIEGYFLENSLENYWLKKIPLFLRLREILVYSGAFRSLDFNNLHPWSKEMIETTTINIENDLPFLDIEFT
jgi:amicoumacin kinase